VAIPPLRKRRDDIASLALELLADAAAAGAGERWDAARILRAGFGGSSIVWKRGPMGRPQGRIRVSWMIATTLALSLFLSAPDAMTPAEVVGAPLPAAPRRVDVQQFADTRTDGSQVWGAAATYDLSSGDSGEAFLVIDSEGTGEAQLLINGDIVAHVSIALDPTTAQPVTTTCP